jgi:hypothetical protein
MHMASGDGMYFRRYCAETNIAGQAQFLSSAILSGTENLIGYIFSLTDL